MDDSSRVKGEGPAVDIGESPTIDAFRGRTVTRKLRLEPSFEVDFEDGGCGGRRRRGGLLEGEWHSQGHTEVHALY